MLKYLVIVIGALTFASGASAQSVPPGADVLAYQQLLTEANARIAGEAKTIADLQQQIAKLKDAGRPTEPKQEK